MYNSKPEDQASSAFHNNAIFFVEIDKVKPNPYQPRKEFDEQALNALAESIRMYGVLQPMTVCRQERVREDGSLVAEYELVAGERRLRASKIAGLREVPVLIRAAEDDDRVKLELAIIENLQREDLTPVDRAKAFHQLADEFGFKHTQIAKKVGKSREYVSNSIRLLALPDEILDAITDRRITEGHARPLMMLSDRPEEQLVLFKEIMLKKMTVRDAEKISRRVAYDKVRKKDRMVAPDIIELEHEVSDALGTRVQIEQKAEGGRIYIDYFSQDDLRKILLAMKHEEMTSPGGDSVGLQTENTEESISSAGIEVEKESIPAQQEEVQNVNQSFAQAIHAPQSQESVSTTQTEKITDYITNQSQQDTTPQYSQYGSSDTAQDNQNTYQKPEEVHTNTSDTTNKFTI